MKNVAYMFALAASLLTVSGFLGCGSDKKADDLGEHRPMAANEATAVVASAEVAEQTATEQKVEEAPVATAEAAATMPMNEEKAA